VNVRFLRSSSNSSDAAKRRGIEPSGENKKIRVSEFRNAERGRSLELLRLGRGGVDARGGVRHQALEALLAGGVAIDRAHAEQVLAAVVVATDDDVRLRADAHRRRGPTAELDRLDRVLLVELEAEVRVAALRLVPAHRGRDELAHALLARGHDDRLRLVDRQADALDRVADGQLLLVPHGDDAVLLEGTHDLRDVRREDAIAAHERRVHRVTADDVELLDATVHGSRELGQRTVDAVATHDERALARATEQQERARLGRGPADLLAVPVEHRAREVAERLAVVVVRHEVLVEARDVDPVLHRRDEGEVVVVGQEQARGLLLRQRHRRVADGVAVHVRDRDVELHAVAADAGGEDVGRIERALTEGRLDRGRDHLLGPHGAHENHVLAIDLDGLRTDAGLAGEQVVLHLSFFPFPHVLPAQPYAKRVTPLTFMSELGEVCLSVKNVSSILRLAKISV